MVITAGQIGKNVELPVWWSRGVIVDFNEQKLEYDIVLPDYGSRVSLGRHQFMTIPSDSVPDAFLLYPICLYNVLPGVLKTFITPEKQRKFDVVIKREWSQNAVSLTKSLMAAADKAYFDYIAEKDGRKYGEIYLIIEDQVISLRKALVTSNLAVYVKEDWYQKIASKRGTESGSSTSNTESLELIAEAPLLTPEDSPNLLLKLDSTENNAKLSPRLKKQHYGEIFISSHVECRRLTTIADALFAPSIHNALETMKIKFLWKIPSYTWPAISKGLDVLSIGARGTGKTLGYAAAIANITVATRDQQEDNYPMVLVLCASTDEVQTIHDTFHQLLAGHSDIAVVSGFNGVHFRALTVKLYNGCHILVSTPAFLQRYLQRDDSHRKVLNLNYLRHVIFDRLDVLWEKYKPALTEVLKHTPIVKSKSQNLNQFTIQMIATAERWSTTLGKFTEKFSDPYICIGSYPDAVISCGVQPKLRQIPSAEKPEKIREILKDHYKVVKTLIVCSRRSEASRLNVYLSQHCNTLYVHQKYQIAEIHGTKECWDLAISGQYPVLICIDRDLHALQVTNAEWLIHYSIATPTKSMFYFRFSTLMSSLKDKGKKLEVTIVLDETNDVQLQGVMDLMQRSGVKFREEQLKVSNKIMMQLDRSKNAYPICNLVKALSYCPKKYKCPYRHCVLADVDKPSVPVRSGDQVKLLVLYIHRATHFSGRIIESDSGETSDLPEKAHCDIVDSVQRHYANRKNRSINRNVQVGGIYGYMAGKDDFKRAQVINIVKKDFADRPEYVEVRCIDTGVVVNRVRAGALLEMPEQLAKTPAYVVEIFLANVMPYDNEEEWSTSAKNCSFHWLKETGPVDRYLQGTVQLVLGNTIWVDPLEIKMKVVGMRDQQCTSLKRHLIQNHHGIPADEHMKRLQKLCRIGELPDPV